MKIVLASLFSLTVQLVDPDLSGTKNICDCQEMVL
jgi:hypothetical protein